MTDLPEKKPQDDLMPASNIPCLDAIEKGICRADCCRTTTVPFLKFFYNSLTAKRYCEPEEIIEFGEIVYPVRSDCICVFLNQQSNLCGIYHLRPQICSTFGRTHNCYHYDCNGRRLSRAEKRRYEYDSKESSAKGVIDLKKKMQRESRKGWTPEKGIAENPEQYTEMRSLATPEIAIRGLQKIAPWMVIDAELEGGGK